MSRRSYERTRPGEVEVKRLPAARVYETHRERGREGRNEAFGRLFRYLRRNKLNMTSPVEMGRERMRFIAPREARLEDEGQVRVVDVPERMVVSAGLRGGYGKEKVEEGERAARRFLASHPQWRAAGPPEVAYWHGPMMPSPLRQMEVHLPVEPDPAAADETPP